MCVLATDPGPRPSVGTNDASLLRCSWTTVPRISNNYRGSPAATSFFLPSPSLLYWILLMLI